jgi:CRP/FNR family transcriptional regulator
LQNTPGETLETTHQAIANELGSSREVVSRQLKEMEREGLVRLSRGRIGIGDRAMLNALCKESMPGE